jgi:cytoskeletal protein CcmA (bactofilin family)
MFGERKPAKPQSRIDSLIGAGTRIDGDVQFSGGLRIDGEVRGKVTAAPDAPATLVVSEQARVEGEIRVSHVVINGAVVGPVHAAEFLELQAKARITGDVHYHRIEMHLGAVVEGRLVHVAADEAARTVELKLAASQ